MKNKRPHQEIVIYQTKSGKIEFRGDFVHETIWASQADIAQIFGVTPQNITMHIKRIYHDQELAERATCKEFLQVQTEGKRQVQRMVKEYNLDVIIAVGYRINSVTATKFRQWATKTLRDHLIEGYTINRTQILKNYDAFMAAVGQIHNRRTKYQSQCFDCTHASDCGESTEEKRADGGARDDFAFDKYHISFLYLCLTKNLI